MIDLENEIKNLTPKYLNLLSKLIQIPSEYGNEAEAQIFVKSQLNNLGLKVQEYFSRNDKESLNIVSIIQGSDNKIFQSLILNAHCDIAPIDDPERWQNNPLSGKIEDNKIYGRGSQDDKAGIVVMLMIAELISKLNIQLKGDLILQSVIEDETTGNGSKTLIENGYNADGIIIIDGTGPERIIYGHLGQIWLNIDIVGEPVAACVEKRGVNPIYIALDFITQLREFISKKNIEISEYEGIIDPFIMNVGYFNSGTSPMSSPSRAKIAIQIGFPPPCTPDSIYNAVLDIARSISDRINVSKGLLSTPSVKVNKNGYFISKFESYIRKNTSKEVNKIMVTGHCDMRHFKTENICLYGPGCGQNAHGIDEIYYIDNMEKVVSNLISFILEWCNEKRA